MDSAIIFDMPSLLIADDSPHKTAMLLDLLAISQWKGDILQATTTEEATRLIDTHPDIKFGFIDYYIPSGNGPSVIRHLKNKNPTAHIALVSSSDRSDNQEQALAAGAEACICTGDRSDIVERSILEILNEWKDIDS